MPIAAIRATGFLPHGYCYLWDRPLLLTHLVSDLSIGVSYVAISLALTYFVHRARREIPFGMIFLAFGTFIVACGMTHLIEVWTLWTPVYWFAGGVKVITAVASVATAAAMPFTIPKAVAMLRDAQTAEERRIELAAATQANQAKSQFMATVSHELRTPLNAIIGYSDLLEMGVCGPLTPEQTDKIERMRHSANHLTTLINEILNFERLESGHEQLLPEPTDVTEILRATAADVEPVALQKGIRVVVEAPATPIVFVTDATKLRQILANLLSNAVKYSNTGEVRVSAHLTDHTMQLQVRDTGIGIAPEHQERIFDPFWQADQRLTRKVGGTGLGLSIVRRLVVLLGGEIRVVSSPGRGSTFTVRLPQVSVQVEASV